MASSRVTLPMLAERVDDTNKVVAEIRASLQWIVRLLIGGLLTLFVSVVVALITRSI